MALLEHFFEKGPKCEFSIAFMGQKDLSEHLFNYVNLKGV